MWNFKSLINELLPLISKSEDEANLLDPKSKNLPNSKIPNKQVDIGITQTVKSKKDPDSKNKLFNNVKKRLPIFEISDDYSEFKPFLKDFLDPMFEDAARVIVRHQQGSVSLLQRRLKLGYSRAARIVDQLEEAGIVGPNVGGKNRSVLIKEEKQLEDIFGKIKYK